MESNTKLLNSVKFSGGILLTIGIFTFLYSFLVSDYSNLTGIAIGIIMSSVFIFLIGVFFAATEEMLDNTIKGQKMAPIKSK